MKLSWPKNILHRIAAGLLVAFVASGLAWQAGNASASSADDGIFRDTLPNGLRVILVRNTLAPVVATSVNYLVGSNEVPDGFPGTAHAMEHMMFRGSPGLSADQLAAIGSIMGGNFNANTRENLTQYLFTVPAEDLDVALNIEAARMKGLDSTDADWAQERGAIEQEVAQDISNPNYLLYSKLRAHLFTGTPYEHDALGTKESFDKTTAAMLKEFHDTWYAPNNAILIVAGDLEPEPTLAKIKELFGTIPAKKLPARRPIEPKPFEAVSLSFETDRSTGYQMKAMRVPGLDHEDFPALEVLSDVLNSARGDLYTLAVEGKVLGADFSLDPLPVAGFASLTASFAQGDDPAKVETDVRSVIDKLKRDGVPAELVAAAKLQERRQAEFQKNSIAGLANIWSEAVAVYGLYSPDDDLTRIEKVTVADVNRVLRQYVDLDHAVTAVMLPQGSGRPVASDGGFGGQETIALGEAKQTTLPAWAEAALNRMDVPESSIDPVVSTLPNGITLIVQPSDVSDTVSVYGHVKNRPEVSVPKGQEGISQILDELFDYGTEKLDRLQFQEALDEIGATEGAGVNFSVGVLTRDFDRAVELLADNQLHPRLPEDQLGIIKDQTARVLVQQMKSPGYFTGKSLREALFPVGDPSLREATPETVRALTIQNVRDYYHYAFRPDLTCIVVIGKITPDLARATIEKYFGEWKATGPKPETDLPQAPPNKPALVAVPDSSRVQDSVTLAHTMALTRSDPDFYALALGNAVLGGGFYASRFSIDLRKNTGLVYSVGSNLQAGKTRSVYLVQYASNPENVTKASNIVAQELRDMQDRPVPEDELRRVKALLLRQLPLSESSLGGIARGLGGRWDLDLPLDEPTRAARRYIELGPTDVQAAFKKWIRPGDLVRVSQGPPPG